MTNFSTAFQLTPYETDPTRLPRWSGGYTGSSSNLHIGNTTSYARTATGFWSPISAWISATPWSNTLQTVVNVAGRGKLFGGISPVGSSTATHTFIVTIDGVAYTIPIPATAGSAQVSGFGAIVREKSQANGGIDSAQYATMGGSGGTTMIEIDANPSPFYLINLMEVTRFIPFETSLKVEISSSATSAGPGTNDVRTGVLFNMDP